MLESIFGQAFDPDQDLPDLSGKVILVTGGANGIGKETVRAFAKHNPSQIFVAARTKSKADAAISDLKTQLPNAKLLFLQLDLTSFTSIKQAAETFTSQSQRLDILINNAGVMAVPFSLTTEGYEIQFGTNHVGHALLTKLLLPTLLRTAEDLKADVRVINVSSLGHRFALSSGISFDQAQLEKSQTLQRYGNSKLANILHAQELQRRYPSITATAVHPGIIMTDLYSDVTGWVPFGRQLLSVASRVGITVGVAYDVPGGAKNSLWAATADRELIRSSPFWRPVGINSSQYLHSNKTSQPGELWEWTEKEFTKHGY